MFFCLRTTRLFVPGPDREPNTGPNATTSFTADHHTCTRDHPLMHAPAGTLRCIHFYPLAACTCALAAFSFSFFFVFFLCCLVQKSKVLGMALPPSRILLLLLLLLVATARPRVLLLTTARCSEKIAEGQQLKIFTSLRR